MLLCSGQEVTENQFCAILMNGLPQAVLLILLDIRELMMASKLYRLISHNRKHILFVGFKGALETRIERNTYAIIIKY